MILYAAEGQPTAEIARRLETAPRVVGRWRKRFFEERLAGLEDRERAGPPRRFPPGTGRRGVYFSIVQRKALTPNDFDSLETLPSGYSASATATGKSPGCSTGHSLAQTSTVS
jgi:hypothetical protein